MSFQPPPPPSFVGRPFLHGDAGGVWPQLPLDHSQFPFGHEHSEFQAQFSFSHEHPDVNAQFEYGPPFKRPRISENNLPNSASFAPQFNPRTNPSNLPGGKGTSHIFYKTRMCTKFIEGTCKNGENCTFAHGKDDLREPPPNWQELVRDKEVGGTGNWNDDQRLIHKMKICKKFYNGEECPYGEKCNFLHERPTPSFVDERSRFKHELSRERESSAISIGTRGSSLGSRSDFDQPEIYKPWNSNLDATKAKPAFWKTKLCSKWQMTGLCPFGDRCHFAHGHSELQASSNLDDFEVVVVNPCPVQVKPIAVPVNDSSPADALVEGGEGNDVSKWKLNRKINRIYADWIDDLTPPHSFPSDGEA